MIFAFFSNSISSQEFHQLVDTKIGTKGDALACGYSFIGATYPFGMVQFTPSFFSPQKGFVVTQLSGAGCSNMGNFPVMPISGNLIKSPNDMNALNSYTKINQSTAGYLSVDTNDEINSQLTVTKRSAIAEFNFAFSIDTKEIAIL